MGLTDGELQLIHLTKIQVKKTTEKQQENDLGMYQGYLSYVPFPSQSKLDSSMKRHCSLP